MLKHFAIVDTTMHADFCTSDNSIICDILRSLALKTVVNDKGVANHWFKSQKDAFLKYVSGAFYV